MKAEPLAEHMQPIPHSRKPLFSNAADVAWNRLLMVYQIKAADKAAFLLPLSGENSERVMSPLMFCPAIDERQ